GGLDDPAHGERRTSIRADLDGDLVGRAADAPGLHFDQGHRVLERRLEHVDARLARRGLGERERTVDDAFGGRALAVSHHVVVEVLKRLVAGVRVGRTATLGGAGSAGHRLSGLLLGIRVLRPGQGSALLAVFDARGVERAADDVILDRRQVGDAATAHEHDGVLLQVVADPRDVRGDFHLIGEADSRDLPERGIRLLRGHGADDRADATLLGRAAAQLDVAAFERVPRRAEGGRVYFLALRLASLTYQLRDRWHSDSLLAGRGRARARLWPVYAFRLCS